MWRDSAADRLFPRHETPTVEVAESELSRTSLLGKPYLDEAARERVRAANLLLIPHEGFREEAAVTFPTATEELFTFLRDNAPAGMVVEAAITEGQDHELGLHFDVMTIANLFLEHAIADTAVVLVADWLRQHLGKRHGQTEVDSSLYVQGEDGMMVHVRYRGPTSNYESTIRAALSRDLSDKEESDV